MAMVSSSAFAIILKSSVLVKVFPQDNGVSGSGRKAGRKGGPSEARRLFGWRKPVSGDVAGRRSTAAASGRRWRAEVGTSLPCVRPRPLRFAFGRGSSFEGLVFAEVRDGHPERIDGDQFVGHLALENEDKVRGVQIAFQLAVVGGRVIDRKS